MKSFPLKPSKLKLMLGVAMLVATTSAMAAYPDKPITVLVGYGGGGGADTIARMYADGIAKALNAAVIVENKPGAGGTLAASTVARAAPDGYTLMVAPTAVFTITPNVRKTTYNPIKDFTPISTLATGMDVLILSKTVPANNISEFVAQAKKNPGKYSYASSGLATSTHLMGVVFAEAAGIDMLHVPYKSSSEYLPDLIEGRVSMAFDPVLLGQVAGGKLKLMGIAADKREPAYPDAQTTKEAGIDMAFAYDKLWYGLVGPAGLPAEIVARLSAAVEKISKDPAIAKKLATTGMQPKAITGKDFAEKIKVDSKYYGDLINKLDLKLE
ncbi:tripartite tricarboxylate transporter substrate binding protein [Alcaligenaceae bacterium]|nr:tripartite tricarboxylate transporter substrate binding protein [Alcaligenaceae bacterium]